ncbi:MAG TPA: DUF222 domain-containing protein [Candidatus Udaeobacter sp.]|nr:DUF222 domain-containing protein [Candidatus Udaeobacter sp.]
MTACTDLVPAPAVPEPAAHAAIHREILAQSALTNWSMHRLMTLLRDMEACEGYEEYGCPTLVHYVELACGVSRIAARQRVRVARALGELPLIDHEFAAGKLSYAKVRSLVRIATPETEAEWIEKTKRLTAEDLERVVARSRPGDAPSRRLLVGALNQSTSRMLVDLPAEEMEIISLALDEVRRQMGAKLSLAEALTHLCASWLGGEFGEVKTAERFQVIVHVGEDGKSWVNTDTGPAPVKPDIMERLLCDCTIRFYHEKDGVVAVSRAQRTVSEVTRRAVAARDGRRCRVKGCRRRCWIDLHHRVWYSRGGKHLVTNLIFLCRWHHAQVHEKKLLIEMTATGELIFKAKAGWILGEEGELVPDRAWVQEKMGEDAPVDPDVLEALAALEGDFNQAYQETPEDDRGWTFKPAKNWVARERGPKYEERSRGIAAPKAIPRDRLAHQADRHVGPGP